MLTEIYNDTVSQVNYNFFSECKNNRAIKINRELNITTVFFLSTFKNDDCGLNNILLTAIFTTSNDKRGGVEIAGLVFTKTQNYILIYIQKKMICL